VTGKPARNHRGDPQIPQNRKPAPATPASRRRGEKVAAVMARAEQSGLLNKKDGRIAGRVSANLVKRAKERTGLTSDTELVEFALASIALEDDFAETFRKIKATVDPDLKIGY
jgi:hypothetical protein